jgi:hypothetical protein
VTLAKINAAQRLRELHAAADDCIEMEYTGGAYSEHRDPTKESRAFYEAAHLFVPLLFARVEELEALLAEALDWAERFNGRHDGERKGYASEVLPMFTRIGERNRSERLATIRASLTDDGKGE